MDEGEVTTPVTERRQYQAASVMGPNLLRVMPAWLSLLFVTFAAVSGSLMTYAVMQYRMTAVEKDTADLRASEVLHRKDFNEIELLRRWADKEERLVDENKISIRTSEIELRTLREQHASLKATFENSIVRIEKSLESLVVEIKEMRKDMRVSALK